MNAENKIALVTGANRGIGFETVRQLAQQGFSVILTSRDEEKGEKAANKFIVIDVFKTNIQHPETADTIIRILSRQLPKTKINFDIEDCDRILRVENLNGIAT